MLAEANRPRDLRDPSLGRALRFIHSAGELELDIGCGFGHFLVRDAEAFSQKLFIGVDVSSERVRVINRALETLAIENAIGLQDEAVNFLRSHVPEWRVSTIHVYFPTPNPSGHYTQSRLIDRAFAAEVHRVLVPGGCIRIVTDHDQYFREIRQAFSGADWWRLEWGTPSSGAWLVNTSYEWLYRSLGHRIYAAHFVRL